MSSIYFRNYFDKFEIATTEKYRKIGNREKFEFGRIELQSCILELNKV